MGAAEAAAGKGSPSPRSLAIITSRNGQIKRLNKATFGGEGRGEHSLFAVCQPGTPRNHFLRPLEVKPLIRNNRASERVETIRKIEAELGGQVKIYLLNSLSDPSQGQRPNLSPPLLEGYHGGKGWA